MAAPLPIHVCGPTASGKSALAIEIARRIDGEIVNADALQLYRGLEVLSAAPSATDRAAVPHHLYGVLDPGESCDAMRFRQLARPVIDEIAARGKVPVVTGGSGLYLKFLTHGPSPLPAGDPDLRGRLDALPLETLVSRLRDIDPAEAARTDLHNRRYVTRALEICELSGRPCSELRDQWRQATAAATARLRGWFIQRIRDDLHRRIARRTRAMLDGGAIEEIAALEAAAPNAQQAIGFRQIRDLLEGTLDRPACEELINAATRQYAKRQESWFKRESWLQPLAWKPDADLPELSNRF